MSFDNPQRPGICVEYFLSFPQKNLSPEKTETNQARTYLQLPLRHWGAGNVYLLVLSSWKVNIAENPIAELGL